MRAPRQAELSRPDNRWRLSLHAAASIRLAQAVFAFDLIFFQATDARQRTSAVGHRNGDHDFVRARRIIQAYFHPIEVAADERRIFVSQRNIEHDSQSTAFL